MDKPDLLVCDDCGHVDSYGPMDKCPALVHLGHGPLLPRTRQLEDVIIARMGPWVLNVWRAHCGLGLGETDADLEWLTDTLQRLNDRAKVIGADG